MHLQLTIVLWQVVLLKVRQSYTIQSFSRNDSYASAVEHDQIGFRFESMLLLHLNVHFPHHFLAYESTSRSLAQLSHFISQ